jgi:hypothetical protein
MKPIAVERLRWSDHVLGEIDPADRPATDHARDRVGPG